ncbi:transcription factor IBH1-like 1 [Coffea eugenioides]|uniref:Transcription factor IBH1-like 1 n=1 Tax=Coffea arabica TaxID=13443 RepID=A0A6P6SU94_COFAR|nr:transcription factor IBH1-like 1 [Coffea arabica]XP_027176148.1 transcription factor IBH1-like 1 [Coffea eugenioides]
MRSASSLRQEFLKKWLKGLQIYSGSKKEMSILERKKAIKLSADIAMASTRISTSSWSRALMAKASNDATNKVLVQHVLSPEAQKLVPIKKDPKKLMIISRSTSSISKRISSKKIVRRSCYATRRMRKAAAQVVEASSIAKRLVMKRTEVLKSLVPGGEYMDDVSLIRETLDYILSLRLQVDVMRHFANATEETDHGKGYK